MRNIELGKRAVRLATLFAAGLILACSTTLDDKETGTSTAPPPVGAPPQGQTIQLLVAYTPDAWDALQDTGQDPVAHAAHRTALTNLVFSNSSVTHAVELVGAERLSDAEVDLLAAPMCAGVDPAPCLLDWLSTELDDPYSEAATFRRQAEADLVVAVYSDGLDPQWGGKAYTPQSGFRFAKACAIIEARGDLGFVHEIGHVLGAGHDPLEHDAADTAVLDFGAVYPSPLESYTVMAYQTQCGDTCRRVPWFTNPHATFHGQPLGDANSAYNACVVEYYGGSAADYFEIGATPTFSAPLPPTLCPYTLDNAKSVGGDLCHGVETASSDAELADLSHCGTIRGALRVTGQVTSLAPLASLVRVEGSLIIEALEVTSLAGLESLRSVDSLEIRSPVTSLAALRDVEQVGAIQIVGAAITDLDGLEGAQGLLSLWLEGCGDLTSLLGIPALESLQSLDVVDCEALTNITALSTLTQTGRVRFERNDSLANLNGLESLEQLTGSLTLTRSPLLNNIDALGSMTEVGELNLDDLDSLTGLSGLAALHTVHGNVYIHNNDALQTLDGLSSLHTAEYVSIMGNPMLTSCEFPNLTNYGTILCDVEP